MTKDEISKAAYERFGIVADDGEIVAFSEWIHSAAIEQCAKLCENFEAEVLKPARQYSGQDVDCYHETALRLATLIREIGGIREVLMLASKPTPSKEEMESVIDIIANKTAEKYPGSSKDAIRHAAEWGVWASPWEAAGAKTLSSCGHHARTSENGKTTRYDCGADLGPF